MSDTSDKRKDFTGILLAGGMNSRMGQNKALLNYHGMPQYLWLGEIINPWCSKIVISGKPGDEKLYPEFEMISDKPEFSDAGPMSGILSCIQSTDGPWICLACDYPLFGLQEFLYLVENRNPLASGTIFKNTDTGFSEPVLGIYESDCSQKLVEIYAKGERSLTRAVNILEFHTLYPLINDSLLHGDTPEEKEFILYKLKNEN